MAGDKKNPKEASNIFHSIMKASVSKPVKEAGGENKTMTNKQRQYIVDAIEKKFKVKIDFSAKLLGGYKLVFPNNVGAILEDEIKDFYQTLLKKDL